MNKFWLINSYYGRGNSEPESQFTFQSVQPETLNQVSITFKVDPGYECYIDFGDGQGAQQITANGHDAVMTSSYVTNNTTYDIIISGHLGRLRKMSISSEATVSTLNINDLANTGLSYLALESLGSGITGSINNLPASLCYLSLIGLTGITGDPDNLPISIHYLRLEGTTGISGSVNSLPPDLWNLRLQSIGSSVTGQIDNLPRTIVELAIQSVTTFTGLIDNLPPDLYYCWMLGVGNAITGNIDNLPQGLTTLVIHRSSASGGTYQGSINNLPQNLRYLYLQNLGENITGEIDSLPASVVEVLRIIGCGIIPYNGGALPAWGSVTITLQTGLTTSQVDDFLNTWALTAGEGVKTVDLAGTNEPRSEDSDDAVATLTVLGKTIITN